MATKIRVEQIKTSSGTPSSTTYLRGDGTWATNIFMRVVHGTVASTTRPSAIYVEWIGSVEPTNATNNDTWLVTS